MVNPWMPTSSQTVNVFEGISGYNNDQGLTPSRKVVGLNPHVHSLACGQEVDQEEPQEPQILLSY